MPTSISASVRIDFFAKFFKKHKWFFTFWLVFCTKVKENPDFLNTEVETIELSQITKYLAKIEMQCEYFPTSYLSFVDFSNLVLSNNQQPHHQAPINNHVLVHPRGNNGDTWCYLWYQL